MSDWEIVESCLFGYSGSGPIPDARGALARLRAREQEEPGEYWRRESWKLLRDRAETAEREIRRWLAWSNDQYPDSSSGDVIAAELDGTITLDDGVTTWNPLRSGEFFIDRAKAAEARVQELEKAFAQERRRAINAEELLIRERRGQRTQA